MLEKVVIEVKRIQIQTLEISEENGYDMPTTSRGIVDLATKIRNNPNQFIEDTYWSEEETIITDMAFIDKEV